MSLLSEQSLCFDEQISDIVDRLSSTPCTVEYLTSLPSPHTRHFFSSSATANDSSSCSNNVHSSNSFEKQTCVSLSACDTFCISAASPGSTVYRSNFTSTPPASLLSNSSSEESFLSSNSAFVLKNSLLENIDISAKRPTLAAIGRRQSFDLYDTNTNYLTKIQVKLAPATPENEDHKVSRLPSPCDFSVQSQITLNNINSVNTTNESTQPCDVPSIWSHSRPLVLHRPDYRTFTPELSRKSYTYDTKPFLTPQHNAKKRSCINNASPLRSVTKYTKSVLRALTPKLGSRKKCHKPPFAGMEVPNNKRTAASLQLQSNKHINTKPFFTPNLRRKISLDSDGVTASPKPFLTPDHKTRNHGSASPCGKSSVADYVLPKVIARRLSLSPKLTPKMDGSCPSPTPYYKILSSLVSQADRQFEQTHYNKTISATSGRVANNTVYCSSSYTLESKPSSSQEKVSNMVAASNNLKHQTSPCNSRNPIYAISSHYVETFPRYTQTYSSSCASALTRSFSSQRSYNEPPCISYKQTNYSQHPSSLSPPHLSDSRPRFSTPPYSRTVPRSPQFAPNIINNNHTISSLPFRYHNISSVSPCPVRPSLRALSPSGCSDCPGKLEFFYLFFLVLVNL